MFLEKTLIYFIVGVTSALIIYVGLKRFGMKAVVLREVVGEMAQCVGAFLIFFALNLLIGAVIVFSIRIVWRFFPLYALADEALIVISAFQGFAFQLWWRRSRG